MRQLVDRLGPTIVIRLHDGRAFMVQRHYIALHGLKAEDLPNLGFPQVKAVDWPRSFGP